MTKIYGHSVVNSLRLSDAYIYISKLTIIGSDDGLFPKQHRPIIWNNAGILLIGSLNNLQWKHNLNLYIFIHKNAFENVFCEMLAILSQPQYVNSNGKNP